MLLGSWVGYILLKGVLRPWALFLKTLKNKATLDKVWILLEMFQGTQKSQFYFNRYNGCVVVKLQQTMCENQYFPCFEL